MTAGPGGGTGTRQIASLLVVAASIAAALAMPSPPVAVAPEGGASRGVGGAQGVGASQAAVSAPTPGALAGAAASTSPHNNVQDSEASRNDRIEAYQAMMAALPDPTAWLVDAQTGLHYRRATAQEREVNEWNAALYLVEGTQLWNATRGVQNVTMLVPINDTAVEHYAWHLSRSRSVRVASMGVGDGPGGSSVSDEMAYQYRADQGQVPPAGGSFTAMSDAFSGQVFLATMAGPLMSASPNWNLTAMPGEPAHREQLYAVWLAPMVVHEAPESTGRPTSSQAP